MYKFLATALIVLSSMACSLVERPLYVVHIHGNWCNTCSKIDSVVHEAEKYLNSRRNVEYVMFDETDPASIKASAELAKEKGLSDLFEHERHTGEVLFVDRGSKKVLTRFYAVASKDQYIQATEDLLARKPVQDILATKGNYQLSKPELDTIQKAELYVVDIHHDMCGGCAITAPIFEEVAERYIKDDKVCFFTFDLTTHESVDQTRELAQALGLEDIYNHHKHTGEVLFINAKTKEVVDTLVLETSKRKYRSLIRKYS